MLVCVTGITDNHSYERNASEISRSTFTLSALQVDFGLHRRERDFLSWMRSSQLVRKKNPATSHALLESWLTTDGWFAKAAKEMIRPLSFVGIPVAVNFHRKNGSTTKSMEPKSKARPEQDRPRERLLAKGAEQLRNAELIAILIRSGRPGESAVTGGEKVAKAFDSRLEELPFAGRAELKEVTCAVEKNGLLPNHGWN